ncbi:hypothetical protein EA749_02940 [Acinetobacter radioresistens]|uniref:hypothetical protein n=1 Tax=Acinetobacter radioresistens TaxID=40216 RepID=UPI000F79A5DC|nr:hypothetical protein [Acinetobacter radioresistens]RSO70088.1 hypothetical protein EA749_02940 [Acinetobacter radioresistens]
MTKHDNVSLGGIMKATEFVKNYGLSEAISKVEDCEFLRAESFNWLGHEVNCEELKRLVESYELVKEHGSLERAKIYARSIYTAPEVIVRLEQAIADVEACQ